MLLYLGSLVGIYIGAYGTKVVKEVVIRLVTSLIILLCVISRAIAVPMYMRQLGWLGIDAKWDGPLNTASKVMLMVAGVSGVLVILFNVARAFRRQVELHRRLATLAVDEDA